MGDESRSCDEGFLKLLPDDILVRVLAVWILGEQREVLHEAERKTPTVRERERDKSLDLVEQPDLTCYRSRWGLLSWP